MGLPAEPGNTPQTRSSRSGTSIPGARSGRRRPAREITPGRNCACPGGDWPANLPTLPDGFADGFARTSPVGSFAANPLGFFDLGGNAWEWCEDRFAPGGEARVLRGGSWGNVRADFAALPANGSTPFPTRAATSTAFASCWRRQRSGTWKLPANRPARRFSRKIAPSGRRRWSSSRWPPGRWRTPSGWTGYQPLAISGRVVAAAPLLLHAPLKSARGPQARQPWENGLGMRFVPVGQTLLFSVWTTRVMDYTRFCQGTGRTAPPVDFVQGPTHPGGQREPG